MIGDCNGDPEYKCWPHGARWNGTEGTKKLQISRSHTAKISIYELERVKDRTDFVNPMMPDDEIPLYLASRGFGFDMSFEDYKKKPWICTWEGLSINGEPNHWGKGGVGDHYSVESNTIRYLDLREKIAVVDSTTTSIAYDAQGEEMGNTMHRTGTKADGCPGVRGSVFVSDQLKFPGTSIEVRVASEEYLLIGQNKYHFSESESKYSETYHITMGMGCCAYVYPCGGMTCNYWFVKSYSCKDGVDKSEYYTNWSEEMLPEFYWAPWISDHFDKFQTEKDAMLLYKDIWELGLNPGEYTWYPVSGNHIDTLFMGSIATSKDRDVFYEITDRAGKVHTDLIEIATGVSHERELLKLKEFNRPDLQDRPAGQEAPEGAPEGGEFTFSVIAPL